MKNYIILIAIVFISFKGFTQQTGEQELGAWYTLDVQNKISKKVSLTTMAQFRLFETINNLEIGLGYLGLNYNFNPKLTGTIGYMRLNIDKTFEDILDEKHINENRLIEQVVLKNSLGKVKIIHRYMLEQRFLELPTKNDFQQRMRYRLQAIVPLSKTLFLNVYDEIIMNLQKNAFSQNRLHAALGYKFNQNLNVQMGYLKQSFETKAYDRLMLGLFIKTDFSKKEAKK